MDICKNLNSIKHFETSVLTIGSFDGMHRGHFEIISTLQNLASSSADQMNKCSGLADNTVVSAQSTKACIQQVFDSITLVDQQISHINNVLQEQKVVVHDNSVIANRMQEISEETVSAALYLNDQSAQISKQSDALVELGMAMGRR